jgi:hypothetical protein
MTAGVAGWGGPYCRSAVVAGMTAARPNAGTLGLPARMPITV